ncbi:MULTISPECIES: CD1247 N-terminal domain-containing protein [Bacillales]|jgi:hypothetical protein|uniref:DUF1963 domain-containing protein n=1 Tax=Brevibacillus aydinogluensis TaxID=927786 RepID=A0AA48MCD1_9BACL|nr:MULTISPECIES: CD1247 N-terminal domain-containing protein [Bacillales]MBR8659200.1 hypothetical protein [Brevibacillus sp. NL20B1]MDT3415230.1 hypothetical protein [Brevibacillus aydinogluensis]NNV02756.1 hypothetical protein [Brevibacillus sp. MCWH]UFJ60333.1 hypothetical protein IRT44_13675 [Anoxybacillus sediminis]CAJ1002994.1 DUF1963 domain-containing protein [Brevibacillus aydinogluensis]
MLETLENRIAYLRGLAEGLDIQENSREGKILAEMIELVDDIYGAFRELHARVEETERYAEAIDEDLEDVELYLFNDDEALYETVEDCSVDGQAAYESFADHDDDEDAHLYETGERDHVLSSHALECPSCREVLFFHEGVDGEGYHHYIVEPYRDEAEYEPINPT